MRKESTTSIMRRGFISTLAMCAAMLVSCSSENDAINNGNGENGDTELLGKGVYCTVEQQEPVGFDEQSRSTMTYNSATGMKFAWQADDKLTIFPSISDDHANYSLSSDRGSSLNAYFTGGGFDLTKGEIYYALSKEQGNALTASDCDFSSKKNLKFNYDGQRQTADKNTDHLGKYDFMAASGECTADNLVSLHFKHLGPTLCIIFEAPQILDEHGVVKESETTAAQTEFKAKSFTELTIYSSDNTFRQPVRHLDLTQGLQLDNTYSPKWKDIDKTTDDYINAKPFTLKLGTEPVAPAAETGFQPNASTGELTAFMMIPPENFSSKNIVFTLKATDGTEYYMTCTGKDLDPAKAYQMRGKAKKATQFELTLKINHLYQHGGGDVPSRATGDPGYDKDITLPTHLYYIFCVDGKVKKVANNAVNSITGIPAGYWITTETNDANKKECISKYVGEDKDHPTTFTFSVTEDETDVTKNVYFVAATADLSTTFSGIVEGTKESDVQALVYDIQNPTDQATSQTFLSGLYSTPFVSSETFVGHLTGVVKDVFLYHVAAKVDLKWNSATMMSTTGTNNEIKVTGVKNSGLSLFKPTTNTNAAGSYNVSTAITPGTMFNGRQVYYLPQFSDNKYNVTIGPKIYDGGADYEDKYEFKDVSIDGGFTSWYRALIKQ